MIRPDDDAGKGAGSPFQVPAEGWLAVLKRTWTEMGDDNVGIIAAGIAFYAFAAIVPLLGAVVLSYGLFADGDTVRSNIEGLFAAIPREAAAIITEQLLNVVKSSEGKQGLGLVVALALAWYGATKGASAIVTGLNVAYDTKETRGFITLNLLQLAIVAGGVAVIFLAVGTTTLLAFLQSLIPGAPAALVGLIRVAGYLLLALLVVTGAALLFRFGPDHRQRRWTWLSPGSAGATLLWLAGTALFGFYVSNVGDYGATYGSLSAVIVMLTWLWLSAYVFLLGAELNAELERQVEGDGAAASAAAARGDLGGELGAAQPALLVGQALPPANTQSTAVTPTTHVEGSSALLGMLAANGLVATLGFVLFRRGKPSATVVVALAALLVWRDRKSRESEPPP